MREGGCIPLLLSIKLLPGVESDILAIKTIGFVFAFLTQYRDRGREGESERGGERLRNRGREVGRERRGHGRCATERSQKSNDSPPKFDLSFYK